MLDGKDRKPRATHENTRIKTTKFVLLLRVASCVFVVRSFFIEHDETLASGYISLPVQRASSVSVSQMETSRRLSRLTSCPIGYSR